MRKNGPIVIIEDDLNDQQILKGLKRGKGTYNRFSTSLQEPASAPIFWHSRKSRILPSTGPWPKLYFQNND